MYIVRQTNFDKLVDKIKEATTANVYTFQETMEERAADDQKKKNLVRSTQSTKETEFLSFGEEDGAHDCKDNLVTCRPY